MFGRNCQESVYLGPAEGTVTGDDVTGNEELGKVWSEWGQKIPGDLNTGRTGGDLWWPLGRGETERTEAFSKGRGCGMEKG